jgi:SET domain-containing protein
MCKTDYIQPQAIINESTINGGGRGVFAIRNYKQGELIEICPCIKIEIDKINGKFRDYLFGFDDKMALVGFGYCSLYNHSDTPNSKWTVVNENKIKIRAEKDINKGEEIFVSYGNAYWTTRTK